MESYVQAQLWALIPALAALAGGLLAEATHVSEQKLSYALHAAAGSIIAAVGVELMPRTLDAAAPWVIVAAFVLGGASFELLDWALGLLQELAAAEGESTSHRAEHPWILLVGVAVDLFTDGLMIGAGAALAPALSVVLALAAAPAQVPSGFVTIASLKRHGVPRGKRLIASGLFAVVLSLGTPAGYWIARDQSNTIQLSVLAFTAGALTVLVVEEMAPRAHRTAEARACSLLFLGAFAVFALVALYVR